jgi:hypothetical protein
VRLLAPPLVPRILGDNHARLARGAFLSCWRVAAFAPPPDYHGANVADAAASSDPLIAARAVFGFIAVLVAAE